MADKVITYKVKVVNESGEIVETLASDFSSLKKSVSDLEKELENTEFGSEQFKQLEKDLKASKGALSDAQSASQSFGDKLSSIPGPIGGVIQGIQGLNKTLMLLVANPIGATIAAIVAALTLLYKAFASTNDGADKIEQTMAGLSAVVDVLRDRFLVLAQAVGQLFSGNITGAIKSFKAALGGITEEMTKEFNAASKLTKQLQDLDDQERALNMRRAEVNVQIAKARELLTDESAALSDRQKALNEVRKAEESLAKQEEDLARKRYEAIKAQNALSDSSDEALNQEAQAYIELQGKIEATAAKSRSFNKLQARLNKEAEADKKERDKAAEEALKEQAKNEEEYQKLKRQLELGTIEEARQRDLEKTQTEKEEQDKRINALLVSEEKKIELLALNEEQLRVKLAEVNAKYDKEAQDKIDAKRKEEYDKQVALIDSLLELDRLKYEDMATLTEDDLNQTIKLMTEKANLLLQNEQLTAEQRLLIEKQLQGNIRKLTEDTARAQWEAEKLKFQAIANAFGDIATIAGEASGLAKVAAVAQATINTYLSATEAYKATVGIPIVGPALAPIAAAAAVAAGLKTVQQITGIFTDQQTLTPPKFAQGGVVMGQGSSTSDNITAMVSPGESILTARATRMFYPILSMMNQMGGGARFSGGITSTGVDAAQMEMLNTMKKQQDKPVRAYVTSSQMTNQMMLDRASKSRSLI